MSYLYRTGNGRNNIAYTTTANSSTKYLRRLGSGRTNITWTTIPAGSTYNILNRNGTGRNNILWANLKIANPGDPQYSTDISGGQLTHLNTTVTRLIMHISAMLLQGTNSRSLTLQCTTELNGTTMYCTHGKGSIIASTSSIYNAEIGINGDRLTTGNGQVLYNAKKLTLQNPSDGAWVTYKLDNPKTPVYHVQYKAIEWDGTYRNKIQIRSSMDTSNLYTYMNDRRNQTLNFYFSSVY